MIDFNTVDMVIAGLILFLSLKGLVNGFIKELFNFIGLVVGVAVAARMNTTVGQFISENIFPIANEPALKMVGFMTVLVAIWVISMLFSSIMEKLASAEVGFFSRILGYILTILRYVAIFAAILVSVQNVDLISKKLETYSEDSKIITSLEEIGKKLLNREVSEENNETKVKTEKLDLKSYPMDNNETNKTSE
ncbi:MAG: CvpA family protein [Sulfurovaceae bacterium]|nr:CvpA family protein [Sulfurovaceae bacterium]